jgi:hypothetical protein
MNYWKPIGVGRIIYILSFAARYSCVRVSSSSPKSYICDLTPLLGDLVNSGPYVTPFLLSAVLAQAARYSDRLDAAELGAYFSQRTVNDMAVEIAKGSSIPTLQGLLIFAGLECTIGRSSQGWLYLGMAIRMMQDMGIHINNRKLIEGQFSQLELAMRQQILWSCYTCDKAVSLCLGRAPMLHDTVPLPTADSMLDGEDVEEEPWTPRFATISALESGVVQKAKTNSRFVAYCQLCVVSKAKWEMRRGG